MFLFTAALQIRMVMSIQVKFRKIFSGKKRFDKFIMYNRSKDVNDKHCKPLINKKQNSEHLYN